MFHSRCSIRDVPCEMFDSRCSTRDVPFEMFHARCSIRDVPREMLMEKDPTFAVGILTLQTTGADFSSNHKTQTHNSPKHNDLGTPTSIASTRERDLVRLLFSFPKTALSHHQKPLPSPQKQTNTHQNTAHPPRNPSKPRNPTIN